MSKNDVHFIIDAVGHDFLLGIGMTERSIRHARSSGKFAARWFAAIDEACASRGVECPKSAFSFEGVDKQIGRKRENVKGCA